MSLRCLAGILGMICAVFVSIARADDVPGEHELGKFRNTYYYLVDEADYASLPTDNVILDMQDHVIEKVSTRFRRAVDIEGTGKLINGMAINFAAVKDGSTRYEATVHPWGRGVGDCELIPFHSIAVDRSRIPMGATVRIAETVGMKLPDGTLHDGIWHAVDVGGAIKRDRIDLFVGLEKNGRVLDKSGIDNLQALKVTLVAPPGEDKCWTKSPH